MLRGLLLVLVHILVAPPLAFLGGAITLFAPRLEMVPRVARAWARCVARTLGLEVRVVGADRLATGPAVIVANHTSSVDVYLYCLLLPIPFRLVAKEALFRIPVFGWALRVGGFVPLERSGRRTDVRRLTAIRWDPARRAVVAFFPEGTRSIDGRLRRFKRGAFLTAIREQVPVLPVAIIGAHRIQRAKSFRARAGVVEIRVLEPIPTTGLAESDRDRVCDAAYEAIRSALPPDQQPGP